MNENKPAVPSPFEGLPERKPFSASRREIWIALAMYFAAYLYIDRVFFRSVDGENGVPWSARRSNQFILNEISPGISLAKVLEFQL